MSSSNADSGRDARDILQVLLNAPQLTQYYHFDVRPERVPLRIINTTPHEIVGDGLTASGKKAELSRERSDRAIEITDFRIDGDAADIAFTFDVEGVMGKASFKRQQGTWKVDKLSISER